MMSKASLPLGVHAATGQGMPRPQLMGQLPMGFCWTGFGPSSDWMPLIPGIYKQPCQHITQAWFSVATIWKPTTNWGKGQRHGTLDAKSKIFLIYRALLLMPSLGLLDSASLAILIGQSRISNLPHILMVQYFTHPDTQGKPRIYIELHIQYAKQIASGHGRIFSA